jgi:hypothetical protein
MSRMEERQLENAAILGKSVKNESFLFADKLVFDCPKTS